MTIRPLLKCLWPVLRRGSGEVQLGIDPTHAVVLCGLNEAQIVALESLDGTRELPAVLAESPGLVSSLQRRGLLADTADTGDLPVGLRAALAPEADALVRTAGPRQGYDALARRRDSLVLVCGRGALPMAAATLLRRAGVGQVRVGPETADEQPGQHSEPAEPALVVLTAAQAIGPGAAESWRRRGIPVLPVVMHLVEAVVGPLVAAGTPCLRCLDLTRADLDTAWPLLAGQLTRPAVGRGPEVGGETSLVAVTAALATMVALAALDGQPVPSGRSLEVALPWPGVRQRQWVVHPRCSCAADDVSDRPADADDPGQARMAG
ncbi:hypothetical protein [Nostocoides sp. HKS02]|uniref:hypothetical protein n=1 Tax=Nostocoides sp. HKS02 TaxID=1813880 RepID=UPI0012B46154|nr:hypothetical protein [Tetrasphaera sp. HKS02]QGN58098.1 hypothetical protein GKE56_09600 [Tetrasphaera sp. HKS02]